MDIHAAPLPPPYICEEESFLAVERRLFDDGPDPEQLRRAFLSNPREIRRSPHSPPPSSIGSMLTPRPLAEATLEEFRVGRFYVVATRLRL